MQEILLLLIAYFGFGALGFIAVRRVRATLRAPLLAFLNMGGLLLLCLVLAWRTGDVAKALLFGVGGWLGYTALVLSHFAVLKFAPQRAGPFSLGWPIVLLIAFKTFAALATGLELRLTVELLIGFSYMAFRLSSMASEVTNGAAPTPSLAEHLAFAFFLPTMMVGPISQYSTFRSSLLDDSHARTPTRRSLLRLLVGATKALYLAPIVNQLSYSSLMLDGHPHGAFDLCVSAVSFYAFLYLNFSGYCDMAIGAGGLAGVHIEENFDNPFVARNAREFWNRWHITLSTFMRNMLFAPLSKALTRRLGVQNSNHAIAISIGTVFVLVGLWHQFSWSFLLFGTIHAAAVVGNHYYSIALKKYLGRERFAAYNKSVAVRLVATAATLVFISATLVLVANDLPALRKVIAALG